MTSKGTGNGKSNGKCEMRGSLRCATDDETVCWSGRDDAWFSSGRRKTTAKTTAGPSTAQFASARTPVRLRSGSGRHLLGGARERTKARAKTTADSSPSTLLRVRNDKQRCPMTNNGVEMTDEAAERQVKKTAIYCVFGIGCRGAGSAGSVTVSLRARGSCCWALP
jgi:hypothetical protein